jgi:CrcB protein
MLLFYAGLGGAVGAMLRYVTSARISAWLGLSFPYGIMGVNILGSFLMGLFIEAMARLSLPFPQEIRTFVAVGILGGFTTFSSFSLDALTLYQEGRVLDAGLYVGGSVLLGLIGIVAGIYVGRGVF